MNIVNAKKMRISLLVQFSFDFWPGAVKLRG